MRKSRQFPLMLLLAALLCACGQKALEIPDYPLTKETVTAAVEAAGLPFTVEPVAQGALLREDQTGYGLYLEGGTAADIVASLTSIAPSEEPEDRYLNLSFPTGYFVSTQPEPWQEEGWQTAAELAAGLYGSFSGARALYDAWTEAAAAAEGQPAGEGTRYTWSGQAEGVACRITWTVLPESAKLQAITLGQEPAA